MPSNIDPYDFEASARRIGMLMTADNSDDDKIQMQGLTQPYTFKDADGGAEGGERRGGVDEAQARAVTEHIKPHGWRGQRR